MIVTQLPAGTTVEDLNRLFKDVGVLLRSNHDIEIAFRVVPSARCS